MPVSKLKTIYFNKHTLQQNRNPDRKKNVQFLECVTSRFAAHDVSLRPLIIKAALPDVVNEVLEAVEGGWIQTHQHETMFYVIFIFVCH